MTVNESKSVTKAPYGGMTADEAIALHAERDGKALYFCSDHCRQKYLSEPRWSDAHAYESIPR